MQGVVLQTYGVGNAPNNREDLISEFKNAMDHGVIILNCTQCIRGPVMDSYATGRVNIYFDVQCDIMASNDFTVRDLSSLAM